MARNSIQWMRISAEGAAIVLSILLAFWIDAWWDERQTHEWQEAQLAAIRDELLHNLDQLKSTSARHERNAEHARILAEQSRESEGELITILGRTVASLVSWSTSDISTGSLEALLASGRLGDIENLEIRRLLASWRSEVADTLEDEILARDFVENVLAPGLLGEGVLDAAYLNRPQPGRPDDFNPDQDVTVPSSPKLTELATIRWTHSSMVLGSIRGLETKIQNLLDLISAELEKE